MKFSSALLAASLLMLTACTSVPFDTSDQHIKETPKPLGVPPKIVQTAPLPEPPSSYKQPDVFTVVVNNVAAKELLFAIARDANVEIDISGEVTGEVTLNAIDVTFDQLLERISRQAPIRYSTVNNVVRVEPDAPYLKHYEVSYVNMARTSESVIAIATEVSSTGGSNSDSIGNISSTSIKNTSKHEFWTTLANNIDSIMQQGAQEDLGLIETLLPSSEDLAISETDNASTATGGTDEEATDSNPNIITSPESGMISVYATQQQHHQIQEYLDRALTGAQRQVFIEATIVEVDLNDDYQAGVDWSRVVQTGENGFSFTQALTGNNFINSPVTTLQYDNSGNKYNANATVRLLNQFGNAKVLSTPKILALNNQTALLKVVDNRIYFTLDVDVETTEFSTNRTIESTIHTLPVGLVMSVTPQTSTNGEITLNVRPTISRILRFVTDPNPILAEQDIENLIPEVSVREIETILKVRNGDVAVIGGLMQDNRSNSTDGIPKASKLPVVGDLFSYKENRASKSELVIFLKPVVVDKPSLQGEFAQYKRFLEKNSTSDSRAVQ